MPTFRILYKCKPVRKLVEHATFYQALPHLSKNFLRYMLDLAEKPIVFAYSNMFRSLNRISASLGSPTIRSGVWVLLHC